MALRPFLRQRSWVDSEALASRLRRYGRLQVGAPDDYVESILARLIEAADDPLTLELHQLCMGYAELDGPGQQVLLGRGLGAFSPPGAKP